MDQSEQTKAARYLAYLEAEQTEEIAAYVDDIERQTANAQAYVNTLKEAQQDLHNFRDYITRMVAQRIGATIG